MAGKKSPSGARRASRKNGRGKDIIAILKEDHARVRKLLEELEKTTDRAVAKRQRLREKIAEEVRVHAVLEEEIFYPGFFRALSKDDDAKLFHEAKEEHAVVEAYLDDVVRSNVRSDAFPAKAKVLKDLVEHHAEEEEQELMPRARKLISGAELQDMGSQVTERKRDLGRKGALRDGSARAGRRREPTVPFVRGLQ